MIERSGPEVPSGPAPYAWRRPIGLPYDGPERARQDANPPLIDDGSWGGVPLGGLGAGSIGRTHRGDFARWHLDVGRHRFETIPADQLSVYVGKGDTRWRTAHGAYAVTYGRGLWFRTPEAYLQNGDYRAAMYLRPLAIWAIEHALRQKTTNAAAAGRPKSAEA